MRNKFVFKIIYQTKPLKLAQKFLETCDLHIGDVGFESTMIYTSVNDFTIQQRKEHIILAYESADCSVLHIEGGMVE